MLAFQNINFYRGGSIAFVFIGMLASIIFLYSALYDEFDFLTYAVISEGVLIFFILFMYFLQLNIIEKNNKEKTKTLSLLQTHLAAMEASRDGICIVDKDGRITYANKSLLVLHGVEAKKLSELIGRKWSSLYLHDGQDYIEQSVLPELYDIGFWRGETEVYGADSEVFHVELCLTSLDNGGFIGTVRDVSERKAADVEKKKLETQFFQAQKMEAIGRLAGGIAHDFNNILAAMNGYAEFLIEDLPRETQQHKFALNILQAGKQARDLVDQMLAFSRSGSSKKEEFDLIDSLRESLSMLSATLPKNIEVVESIDLERAPIRGNVSQIGQTIMNLCVNASDAMEDEYGTLSVGLRGVDDAFLEGFGLLYDGQLDKDEASPIYFNEIDSIQTQMMAGKLERGKSYISLQVEDTGSGMSKIIMERIFEPFFTTKAVDKGTGLGLASVHGVVTSHGGAIIIDAKLGKGTSFELILPVLDACAEYSAARINDKIEGNGQSILVVDDQENVRDVVDKILQRLGYKVHKCSSGFEALDYLRENYDDLDLVITDYNMPKMTGLELVEQASIDLPDLPFIVLSGYSQEKLKDLMKAHPSIKTVLRKPVSKEELSHKVYSALQQHSKRVV